MPPVPPPVNYPIIGSVTSALSVQLSQGYFLLLFDHTFPFGYLFPMKTTPNSGYEIFQATAMMGERVSTALFNLENGLLTIYAPVGQYASGQVAFSRPTFAAGAVTIKAGTIVTTSDSGRNFIVQADVVFGASDLGPHAVAVVAEAVGYEYNVIGPFVSSGGEVIPGEVDTIRTLYEDPAYGDTTFTVAQVATFTGGTSQDLEALGHDRGVDKNPQESVEGYRLRVRTLPDTVSPNAIIRFLDYTLLPLDLSAPYEFIETFDITYQTCWDAPSPNAGTPTYDQGVPPTNPAYNDALFAYDDSLDETGLGLGPARPAVPFENRWLDEFEYRGAFIVTVPPMGLFDVGMAYDDPGMTPLDFKPANGHTQRGTPAYDVPSDANPVIIYPAAYDGYDIGGAAQVLSLWQHLQAIKAFGVAAIVEQQGQ